MYHPESARGFDLGGVEVACTWDMRGAAMAVWKVTLGEGEEDVVVVRYDENVK